MSNKSFYVIRTNSMFTHTYVVPTNAIEGNELQHYIDEGKLKEFSQNHNGEQIVRVEEMKLNKVLELFDEENDYLINWSKDQKVMFINNWQEKTDDQLNDYNINLDVGGGIPFNGITYEDLDQTISVNLTDSSNIAFQDELQLSLDLSEFNNK